MPNGYSDTTEWDRGLRTRASNLKAVHGTASLSTGL